ncbi:Laminin subunit beta-1 [Hondaea fermentalgiana]|uniref:Laminin subunit beta-1 n=1 Tax=Hondaea fermentalgiana TaxID=2315210 RepID=A0A2R5GS25_9STRA|nr:Laminin subunit beta-1 [Hondaea fermentalgiana]|eukprot:GBG33687.1 Laminin subunit beta-1 [Hondaea fermentalgiana]
MMQRTLLAKAALSAASETLSGEAPGEKVQVRRANLNRTSAMAGTQTTTTTATKRRRAPASTRAKRAESARPDANTGTKDDNDDDDDDDDAEGDIMTNTVDENLSIDDLANLAHACRLRDECERDLEAAVTALLRQREAASARMGAQPWSRVQQLAETALSATKELEAVRQETRSARETIVNLRADADRWHAEADALRARMTAGATQGEDDETASAILEAAARLEAKEQECEQLRVQRTRLSADLDAARREAHDAVAQNTSIKRDAEIAKRDLENLKRAAHQRISALESQMRSYREDAEGLRSGEAKMRGQAEKFEAALDESRAESRMLERTSDTLRDDLERSERALKAAQAESARRQALLEQEQLKTQQNALEMDSLSRQVAKLTKDLHAAREATARQERARSEAFSEHEESLEELRKSLEDAREREGALRESLADARAQTNAIREEAAQADNDAQSRIADLEQTLSKLLTNMQSRTLMPRSASLNTDAVGLLSRANEGETENGGGQDAIAARATRIRQEIHAATKHLFPVKSRGPQQQEKEDRNKFTDEYDGKGYVKSTKESEDAHPESEIVSVASRSRDEDAWSRREEPSKRSRARGRPRRRGVVMGAARATGAPYKA